MKPRIALPFAMADKPPLAKPPKSYGKVLMEARQSLGLTRAGFAKKAKIDYVKVMRNEDGREERSVKGSNEVRAKLLELGCKNIPPVPVGDQEWVSPVPTTTPRLDPTEENIRRNLLHARETLQLDHFAVARTAGVGARKALEWETGIDTPTTAQLGRLAESFGCQPGDLMASTPPKLDPVRAQQFWYGGAGTDLMTDAERAAVEKIFDTVTARARALKATRKLKKTK